MADRTRELARANAQLRLEVDARRAVEERLRDANAALEAVFLASPLAIVVTDAQGRVAMWNRAAERLFGWRSAEVVGGAPPEKLVEVLVRGTFEGAEALCPCRDGRSVPVRVFGGPVHAPGGEVLGAVSVVADITAEKQALRALTEKEARLAQAQKMEALGNLAGSIAHEVNNMLVPILGLTQTVAVGMAPGSRERRALETVVDAAARTRDIVRQVLTFSHAVATRAEPLALAPAVKEAVPLLRSAVPRNVTIECNALDAGITVRADATRLQQILLNLAVNAAHAIGAGGGRISITLERCDIKAEAAASPALPPGRYARLRFSDTGAGMDPETASKIFEPFFTTKEVGEGTGMGLPVVHGIVTGWGGTIEVETSPGRGTTFLIYLPLDEGGEIAVGQAAVAVPETE